MLKHTNPLNPSDMERVTACSAFYALDPSACTVDGATVQDGDGFACWVLTLAEVKDAGLWFDPSDLFTHEGVKWVIFPL